MSKAKWYEFAQLRDYGLDIRVIGEEVGQASGLKMCYAALTKGLTAIATELLIASVMHPAIATLTVSS